MALNLRFIITLSCNGKGGFGGGGGGGVFSTSLKGGRKEKGKENGKKHIR